MLLFGVTSSVSAVLSAASHLLSARSPSAHTLMFSIDYLGVALYGYGYGMMLYYTSGNALFYRWMGRVFPYIHVVLTSNITICCSLAKIWYPNTPGFSLDNHRRYRKFLQVGSCALSIIFCKVILLFRLYCYIFSSNDGCNGYDSDGILFNHLYSVLFIVTNAYTFAAHQPEKTFPGKFDLFGHGHQWFHFSVIFCCISQLYASYADIMFLPRTTIAMHELVVSITLLQLLGVVILNIVIVLLCYKEYLKTQKHE